MLKKYSATNKKDSDQWRYHYIKLCEYILKNNRIVIREQSIDMPDDLRRNFFKRLDALKRAYVNYTCPKILNDVQQLSEEYYNLESDFYKQFPNIEIKLPERIRGFYKNPLAALTKDAMNYVFDLVRDKISLEQFDQKLKKSIIDIAHLIYIQGYESWIILGLLNLFQPDAFFGVNLSSRYPEVNSNVSGGDLETREDIVPDPETIKELLLDGQNDNLIPFVVPNFIIHSKLLGRFVAVKWRFIPAKWMANNKSNCRHWIPINEILDDSRFSLKWPTLLIYISNNISDINLVADIDNICRPDILINCIGAREWDIQQLKDNFELYNDTLHPFFGSFLVSRYHPQPSTKYIQKQNFHKGPNFMIVVSDLKQIALKQLINVINIS